MGAGRRCEQDLAARAAGHFAPDADPGRIGNLVRKLACTAVLVTAAFATAPSYVRAQGPAPQEAQDDCGARGVRVLRPEACQSPSKQHPVAAPDIKPAPRVRAPDPVPAVNCARAFATADLRLGAPGFDADLSRLLVQQGDSIIVDPDEPFAAAEPPRALAGWLAEVQRTGGQVSRKAVPCGDRGFSLFRALKQIFAPRTNAYAAAKAYDAILWLEPESGQVTQVQFTRRVAGS